MYHKEFMVKPILIILAIIVGLVLFDRVCLWLESKGWLYWRKNKPDCRGGIGNALQELNSMLAPSTRHTIEAKQIKPKKSEQSEDV